MSPHDPATAYVAVAGYKMNDFRPHIYMTTNYGRSWRKLSRELPERDGAPMLRGGGTMLADYDAHPPFHGPGHFGVCWGCGDRGDDVVSFHYDTPPERPGWDTAALLPLSWDEEGWPRVEW